MSLIDKGTTLEGKYEVLDRLKGGGMSEVYRVRHVHLQEPRVIKLLRADLARDPQAAERFHREARTATQVKHPNVATLYDYSRLGDGTFYTVWEYIEGEDVAHRLKRRGPCPLPVAIDLAQQTLAGLDAIHAAHIVHRDISPDNLMLSRDARGRLWVKIIDLGLAKSLTDPTAFESQAGSFQGKLLYCSPEQVGLLSEGSLDHRTDTYSFALVLYEMICGRLPFETKDQPGFLFKRFTEKPLPLQGRNPDIEVPEELDRILGRALEHDRDRRFPDAASFMIALSKLQVKPAGAAPKTVSTPAADRPQGYVTRKLTGSEKKEILKQIATSSKRIDDSSKLVGQADAALQGGHLDEAAEVIRLIESSSPKLFGLPELKRRLLEEQEKRRQMQLVQTEQMLREYLQEKQQTLAGVALSTLLELSPEHPDKEAFERRMRRLTKETRQHQDEEEAVRAVRESLDREDVEEVRRQLDELEKNDAYRTLVGPLRQELEALEKAQKAGAEIDEHKAKLERALKENKLDDAQGELEALTHFELPKVTLDLYRQRLSELRSDRETQATLEKLEESYLKLLDKESWQEARDLARELGSKVPHSPRAAEMFAEVSRAEEKVHKRQAVEEGTAALEGYLEEGRLAEAELAWKVLSRLAPQHPQRKKFERRLRILRKNQKE